VLERASDENESYARTALNWRTDSTNYCPDFTLSEALDKGHHQKPKRHLFTALFPLDIGPGMMSN